MTDYGEGDAIFDQMVTAAMASEGAVSYTDLRDMPLAEMYHVYKCISKNCSS